MKKNSVRRGVPAVRPVRKFKVVIFTGYSCNNNCVFCVNAGKRGLPEKSTRELLEDVARAARRGADIIELIGGEATIRPDFAGVVAAAKKLGIREVVCATNGRVFADPAAAKRIMASGIDSLIFSVHGPDARVHDALTRVPGSFAQLEKGLAVLAGLGFRKVYGNTAVVKPNVTSLPRLAKFYADRSVRNVEFIFVDPNYGGALLDFDGLVPRISRAAPYMRKALAIGNAAGLTEWKARYVPLCHFTDCVRQVSEINERRLYRTEHWAPDFINYDAIASRAAVGRRKTARCRGCALYGRCEGLWVEYLRRRGDSELKPVKKK
ncbi:MAG: putative Fe-S oxidoreductase [Elusimicrobia bacterium]|nr:MAG: putative Fe-S oxidoreductase [Elusimicrobiota bacterium]KAF0157962.1 MAG: putative Fe-S oxidoreductase [Elusimicrobiota bacterium]